MNVLSFDKQVMVISHLARGSSIRETAEHVSVHRDTVMRLLHEVGNACTNLHNHRVRNLESSIIEVDEIWSFIKKKQGRLSAGDSPQWGDQYTFVALDAISKLVVSYHVGKRQAPEAEIFANDIFARLLGQPQITSDGWRPYIQAFESVFGANMDYGMLVKMVEIMDQLPASQGQQGRTYSQVQVNEAVRSIITGKPNPDHITTAHVERQNLTIRMNCSRFGRKTLAHSKNLENHKAAIALHFAYYNFCRMHETIRGTPAMQAGVAREVWSVADLIKQAREASRLLMAVNQEMPREEEQEPTPPQVDQPFPTMVWTEPPL